MSLRAALALKKMRDSLTHGDIENIRDSITDLMIIVEQQQERIKAMDYKLADAIDVLVESEAGIALVDRWGKELG